MTTPPVDATLHWSTSSNGFVQVAASTIKTAGGTDLCWYLGGGDNAWGLSLAPQGLPAVKHVGGITSEEAAKGTAQEFEDDHAGQHLDFPSYQIVEQYHLRNGDVITRIAGRNAEPLHVGEINAYYGQAAAKLLAKALRKKRLVIRIAGEGGVFVIPVGEVSHLQIVQIDPDGAELRSAPGWPEDTEETA